MSTKLPFKTVFPGG